MAGFYEQMQAMAKDLLKPDSQGGLGQGTIKLTRNVKGTVNPDMPWIPVSDTPVSEILSGAARGVKKEMIGLEMGGTVLMASDMEAICAIPAMGYTAGDTISIDDVPVFIISVTNIPAAGIPAAVKFIIRNQKTGLLNRVG